MNTETHEGGELVDTCLFKSPVANLFVRLRVLCAFVLQLRFRKDRLHHSVREKPPSATSVWPRIQSESVEQRKATTPARSSGRAMRRVGVWDATYSASSSKSGASRMLWVATKPPHTALTLMLSGASSTAR